MKVTLNRAPVKNCGLCGKPLEVGTPGCNFQSSGIVGPTRRVHPECLEKLRREKRFPETDRSGSGVHV